MDLKILEPLPNRRRFIQAGLVAGAGCLTGCNARTLILALSLATRVKDVTTVFLTVAKVADLVLRWECLTANGAAKSSSVFEGGTPLTGERPLTSEEAHTLSQQPVILQNAHGENINIKVLPDSTAKLNLAGDGSQSCIRYRCEGDRTQHIAPVWVPRFVSITRFLKVYCHALPNRRTGLVTMTYGRAAQWQELQADGHQIEVWKKELDAARFETAVS